MTTREELLSFVASFKGVPIESLTPDSPLGLSSLAAQRFLSALKRRYGIEAPEKDFKSLSVQGLLSLLDGGDDVGQRADVPASKATTYRQGLVSNEFGVGVDMENVKEFRRSLDPHSDPFFLDTFTPAEIGYCLLQEDPAQHFAARFCAKEALRKCGPDYTYLAFNEIQITHRPDGSPYYELPHLNRELVNISLSLSHTNDLAIAVAVCGGTLDSDTDARGTLSSPMVPQETTSTNESFASGSLNKSPTLNRKRIVQPSIVLWVLVCLLVGESFVRIL